MNYMRLSKDDTSWRASGLVKKYAPFDEVYVPKASKKNTRKWCKGRIGKEHNIHRYANSYNDRYKDDPFLSCLRISAKCLNCKRHFYGGKPTKDKRNPLHIRVRYECDCKYDSMEYYHKIRVRVGKP